MGVRLAISFAAGFASVITPCVLPLVPGYLSALSSVEPGRLGGAGTARRVVSSSVPFVLGFTVVFVALGAGAAAIGSVVSGYAQTEIAGFVLVALGLLLFFHRDWWLHVALNRALDDLGLTKP